jgi:hypothetical protein
MAISRVNTTKDPTRYGNMEDKCKFRRGRVAFVGNGGMHGNFVAHGPGRDAVEFLNASGGDAATV